MAITTMDRKLRVAAVIVAVGLIAEAISLTWNHPLSFLFALFFGTSLVFFGSLYYLYSLIRGAPR